MQLSTLRLRTFQDDPLDIPTSVLQALTRQLYIDSTEGVQAYRAGEQWWLHAAEIRAQYGYVEITEHRIGLRLTRWLYTLCWTGTDRPSVLFERASTWLVTQKVLLPGCTTLERYVSRLRSRVEARLWKLLTQGINIAQQEKLQALLEVHEGTRKSQLDRLRTGPIMTSSTSLTLALLRLKSVRELGIKLPATTRIPATRIAALAHFAGAAKVNEIVRLPNPRRLATLVAFAHCLEASAQDDALDVLEVVLHNLFGSAVRAEKKARLRTLKDLDQAAATLASACRVLLDPDVQDSELRTQLFGNISRDTLQTAVDGITALIRPANNAYYKELEAKYRTVRRLLPVLVEHIRFGATPAGRPVVAALEWLRVNLTCKKPQSDAPSEVIPKSWRSHIFEDDGTVDRRAYTFCVLEELQSALKRRDVFVAPSWRYADPRTGLLDGSEWQATRRVICHTLGFSASPEPVLAALTKELDSTYRTVLARLPDNPAVRFELVADKQDLVLSRLEKTDEPASLTALRAKVLGMLPRVDLPELLLEIAARTGFGSVAVSISGQFRPCLISAKV